MPGIRNSDWNRIRRAAGCRVRVPHSFAPFANEWEAAVRDVGSPLSLPLSFRPQGGTRRFPARRTPPSLPSADTAACFVCTTKMGVPRVSWFSRPGSGDRPQRGTPVGGSSGASSPALPSDLFSAPLFTEGEGAVSPPGAPRAGEIDFVVGALALVGGRPVVGLGRTGPPAPGSVQ